MIKNDVDTRSIISASDYKGTNIEKAFVNDEIQKGGEGSRGGHVVGHTQSGKVIYGKFGHDAHEDFSERDHLDAHLAHLKQHQKKVKEAISSGGKKNPDWKEDARNHFNEAKKHLAVSGGVKKEGRDKKQSDAEAFHDHEHGETVRKSIDDKFQKGLIDEITYLKANVQLSNLIEKAVKTGEGSKGGRIIGHTKSGKAVYANKGVSEYPNFNAQDHADAAGQHFVQRDGTDSKGLHEHHHGMGEGHRDHSSKLAKVESDAMKTDGIIGNTKSGKKIYHNFDHPSHSKFNKKDHHDAALAHSKESLAYSPAYSGNTEKFDHHWNEGGKHVVASQK